MIILLWTLCIGQCLSIAYSKRPVKFIARTIKFCVHEISQRMVTSNADLVLDCLHQCVRILQHHQLPMIDLIKEYMILLGKIIKNQKMVKTMIVYMELVRALLR